MDEDRVLNSTEFSWKELQRLIDLIPQTDPTTHSYGILLESIERYGAIMQYVDWFLSVKVQNQKPAEKMEAEIIPFPTPANAEGVELEGQVTTEKIACAGVTYDDLSYDPAEVKSLITKARAEKKITSVKEWIHSNWGVDGFTAIPAAKYPEVMAKLAELGVS